MPGNALQLIGPFVLFALMLIVGLELTIADFRRVAAAPRAVVGGTLGQVVLLPLMTWGLVVELWLAAANHPDVGWAVWPEAQTFDEAIEPLAERLLPDVAARVPDFPIYIGLLFQAMQGMGLAQATWPQSESDPTRARALLSRLLRQAFAQPAG